MDSFEEIENNSLLKIGNYGVIRPDYENKENVYRFRQVQKEYLFDSFLFKKLNNDIIYEYYTGIEFKRIDDVFYCECLGLFIEAKNIKPIYKSSSKDVENFVISTLVKKTGKLYNEEADKYFDAAVDIYQDDCEMRRNQQLLLLQHGKIFTEE